MRINVILQLLAFLALWVAPACAKPTIHQSLIRQPSSIFTIGPGTVISVRTLDLPFVGTRYVVRYRSDDGELIELWHLDRNLLLVKGMHGMLTYSTNPERILQFRVLPPTPKEMPVPPHATGSGNRHAPTK
jgi:hypothetical protein